MIRAPFFVTAAAGTADLLASELVALGIEGAREVLGGVACEGDLAAAYRACLESRLGLRVLWQLARFPVTDADTLYAGVRGIDWSTHLDVDATLAVDFSGSVPGVTHTQFGAQRVKDAIVDQFRDEDRRATVRGPRLADVRINAHRRARVAHDRDRPLGREPAPARLSRRAGRRAAQGESRRRDSGARRLAARSRRQAAPFVDPMCGSGTFPIEAALIAADIAPGLLRERFGFERWRQHDAAAWQALRAAAEARRQPDLLTPGRIRGFDRDAGRDPRRAR